MICFLILTELMRFSVEFCVVKFSSFGWDVDMRRIRSDKTLSLGMPKAPQGNIHGRSKQLSLGMPRKASHLSSSSIGNFTWGYIFIHHMICVLLGASIYFVRIFLMLFRIMFCIFYFNKNVKYSLCNAYFASLHVVVSKQKVYRCCKNSLQKSECDKMFKLFAK